MGEAPRRPAGPEPKLTADLVVASNRSPLSLRIDGEGQLVRGHAAGGLAPSLAAALEGHDGEWIAAAMSAAEREAASRAAPVETNEGVRVRLVELAPEVVGAAYRVISNGTLWFLLHGLFDRTNRPVFDRRWHEAFEGYRAYNEAFADAVAEAANEQAIVVVNDYHLCLCGSFLARRRPDLRTVCFLHTPFCSPEELRVLPRAVAAELIGGLGCFGVVAFHSPRWADAFGRCAEAAGVAVTPAVAIPLGVDAAELRRRSESEEIARRREELAASLEGRQLIFRSDRVEPSKNVVRGFLAFEELLVGDPSLRGRVVFAARLYPSREELPEYLAYRSAVEACAQRVNERFGASGYTPVELDIADDPDASVAALTSSDVLVVNPLRDGMNLVAKEGAVLNRAGGVLALSPEAGAYDQLGADAVTVEPFDVTGTAAALKAALEMPEHERRGRGARLAEAASRMPPSEWLSRVTAAARAVITR